MAHLDHEQLLVNLLGSLTFADHLGDVADDVNTVLNALGLDIEWYPGDNDEDIRKLLVQRFSATSLYGSALWNPAEETDDEEDYE